VVADFMVRSPVTVEPWHTVGHIRRQMLLNSFSYLPIFWDGNWHLISDMAIASMLQPLSDANRNILAASQILEALGCPEPLLKLSPASLILASDKVEKLFDHGHPGLWLVVNAKEDDGLKQLVGVLSPFELM
jgi:hypothetical protein